MKLFFPFPNILSPINPIHFNLVLIPVHSHTDAIGWDPFRITFRRIKPFKEERLF